VCPPVYVQVYRGTIKGVRCIFVVEGDFKFQIGTQCQFVQIRGLSASLIRDKLTVAACWGRGLLGSRVVGGDVQAFLLLAVAEAADR